MQAGRDVRGRGVVRGRGGGRSGMRRGRGARGGAAAAFIAAHPQVESSDRGQRLLKVAAESEGAPYEWHPPPGMIQEFGMGWGTTY